MSVGSAWWDVRRWQPTWTVAAGWVALFILVVLFAPDPPCTVASPCGPDWATGALIVGWGSVVVLLPWQPELARWVASVVGVVAVAFSDPAEDPQALLFGGLAVLVPLTWWACEHALRKARRPRQQAREAATAQLLWPGPRLTPALSTGVLLGPGLAVLGLVVILYGYQHQRSEQDWEAGAERVTGTVSKHVDDYVIEVKLPDGSEPRFDTYDSSYYPVGSQQPVWTDGDETRLVAEPYDGSGWGALGLAGVALGLAFVWQGWRRRQGLAQFFTQPQPTTAVGASVVTGGVLLFEGASGWSGPPRWVLPIDEDGQDVPPPPAVRATAYGVLAEGEPVGLVLGDGRQLLGDGPLLEWVADEYGDHGPGGSDDDGADGDGFDDGEGWRAAFEDHGLPPAASTAGVMPIGDGMVTPLLRRLRGPAVMLAALVAAALFVSDSGEGPGTLLYRLAVCAFIYASAYIGAAAAVVVTADGLVVRNPMRALQIPWVAVERVSQFDDGVLLVTHQDGVVPMLGSLGKAWRKAGRTAEAAELAGRLQARVEQERLGEPPFVHPNDRRITSVARWEPGAAAVLFAVVALIAVQLR
jgi:hypothetical protein